MEAAQQAAEAWTRASYLDQNGPTLSLIFSATIGHVAAIAKKGQVIPGFTCVCVLGRGIWANYPATMTVNLRHPRVRRRRGLHYANHDLS